MFSICICFCIYLSVDLYLNSQSYSSYLSNVHHHLVVRGQHSMLCTFFVFIIENVFVFMIIHNFTGFVGTEFQILFYFFMQHVLRYACSKQRTVLSLAHLQCSECFLTCKCYIYLLNRPHCALLWNDLLLCNVASCVLLP